MSRPSIILSFFLVRFLLFTESYGVRAATTQEADEFDLDDWEFAEPEKRESAMDESERGAGPSQSGPSFWGSFFLGRGFRAPVQTGVAAPGAEAIPPRECDGLAPPQEREEEDPDVDRINSADLAFSSSRAADEDCKHHDDPLFLRPRAPSDAPAASTACNGTDASSLSSARSQDGAHDEAESPSPPPAMDGVEEGGHEKAESPSPSPAMDGVEEEHQELDEDSSADHLVSAVVEPPPAPSNKPQLPTKSEIDTADPAGLISSVFGTRLRRWTGGRDEVSSQKTSSSPCVASSPDHVHVADSTLKERLEQQLRKEAGEVASIDVSSSTPRAATTTDSVLECNDDRLRERFAEQRRKEVANAEPLHLEQSTKDRSLFESGLDAELQQILGFRKTLADNAFSVPACLQKSAADCVWAQKLEDACRGKSIQEAVQFWKDAKDENSNAEKKAQNLVRKLRDDELRSVRLALVRTHHQAKEDYMRRRLKETEEQLRIERQTTAAPRKSAAGPRGGVVQQA